MLRYIIGNVTDFTTVGIDIITERTSTDGKALKHIESLTDEQFDIIRFDSKFEFKSDVEELMASPEWTNDSQ